MLKIGIIGNGAVASVIAYFFKEHKIFFYSRKGAINRKIQFVCDQNQIFQIETKASHDPCDIYFICTKSFDLESALSQHIAVVPCKSPIVLLSNGHIIALMDRLKYKYPQHLLFSGVMFLGVTKTGYEQFRLLSKDPYIAIPCESSLKILKTNYFKMVDDFMKVYWLKFFYNVILNTMTGSYRLPYNGAVLSYPKILDKLSLEAYELTKCLSAEYGYDFMSFDEAHKNLHKFIQQVFCNQNSMYVDIEKNKKTEAESLSGLAVGRNGFSLLKSLHSYLT